MEKITRRSFLGIAASAAFALSACEGGGRSSEDYEDASKDQHASKVFKAIMVSNVSGIHDKSFNELSWSGLERLGTELGWDVSYIESSQDADYAAKLEEAVAAGADIVWAIGYSMGEAVNQVAPANPDVQFAIIDSTNTSGAANLTGITFRQQECAFAVGYIAARMSASGKVGFVGGENSEAMQAFEQGYYGGIEYANSEQGTAVTYQGEWTGTFDDPAAGKAVAQAQIADGCDVLFHAAGATGSGMIEACDEAGVWAIGVDMDQSHLAPNTVITSAMKRVDQAIYLISVQLMNGLLAGGTNIALGAFEDVVGIAPTHDLIPDDVYQGTLDILDKIRSGEIMCPTNADELASFKAAL